MQTRIIAIVVISVLLPICTSLAEVGHLGLKIRKHFLP